MNEDKMQMAREALVGPFIEMGLRCTVQCSITYESCNDCGVLDEQLAKVQALKWPNGNPMFAVLDPEQEEAAEEFSGKYQGHGHPDPLAEGWRLTIEGKP